MNRIAFLSTAFTLKKLSDFSKAKLRFHGTENIPGCSGEGPDDDISQGNTSLIFVINHFTRIETLLLPYHIQRLTGKPVWTLAHPSVMKGVLGAFLRQGGAVPLDDKDRDRIMVKSLLAGEASWVVFPEGAMIKSKKTVSSSMFLHDSENGRRRPHTGAASLALRSEFYRKRMEVMGKKVPREAAFLLEKFGLEENPDIFERETALVPVNVTYYPLRSRENIFSSLVENVLDDVPERVVEELITEGSMMLSGVDVDIRFAQPVEVGHFMKDPVIEKDIISEIRVDFDNPIHSSERLREASFDLMLSYMSAVYAGTTLNLDHIIATILTEITSDRFSEYDLKCRVYLATEALQQNPEGLNLHHGLMLSNINLLTDDRFFRFGEFLSFALEKEVLFREGGVLVRNRGKFGEAKDFHKFRLENPVQVMANETEPLKIFRSRISPYIKASPPEIRVMVESHLLKKMEEEFWGDYRAFYIKGESKEVEVVKPFVLEGEEGMDGVVLAHGYMAAPREMQEMAEYLHGKGYHICVPRLKGHGTSPEDLSGREYMDWVESVEEAYVAMRHRCRRVVLGGFSAGAGVALNVASRVVDTAGVFAVCPPMKLQDFSSNFVPAMDVWNQFMKRIKIKRVVKEFVENNPENPHINYFRNPISGVHELEKLMSDVERKLADIEVPVCVIQARNDPVVDSKGSLKLFDRLGSGDKEYFLLNFDRHGIVAGEGATRVHELVGDFLFRILKGDKAGTK